MPGRALTAPRIVAPAYLLTPSFPPSSHFSRVCSQEFYQPDAMADRFVRDLWGGFWGPFMKNTVEPLSAALRVTACIRRKIAQDRVNAMREAAAEEARNVDEVRFICRLHSNHLLQDQVLTPPPSPSIPHQPLRSRRLTGSTSA